MTDEQEVKSLDERDPLLERAQQLPRSLEPTPQLWTAIEAELWGEPKQQPQTLVHSVTAWWPIAALTLIGVATATLVFQSMPPSSNPIAAQSDVAEQVLVKAPPSNSLQSQSRNQMQVQVHQLLDVQLDELPEGVRATVIENLEIIAAARANIRDALAENPNNPLLNSLYLNSYANERTLLKDVEAMARQTKRRTRL